MSQDALSTRLCGRTAPQITFRGGRYQRGTEWGLRSAEPSQSEAVAHVRLGSDRDVPTRPSTSTTLCSEAGEAVTI